MRSPFATKRGLVAQLALRAKISCVKPPGKDDNTMESILLGPDIPFSPEQRLPFLSDAEYDLHKFLSDPAGRPFHWEQFQKFDSYLLACNVSFHVEFPKNDGDDNSLYVPSNWYNNLRLWLKLEASGQTILNPFNTEEWADLHENLHLTAPKSRKAAADSYRNKRFTADTHEQRRTYLDWLAKGRPTSEKRASPRDS